MVDGTGLENQRTKVPQVRILSLPPKNKPRGLYFLATIFQTWMFALIAVFMIIIPILFCNRT